MTFSFLQIEKINISIHCYYSKKTNVFNKVGQNSDLEMIFLVQNLVEKHCFGSRTQGVLRTRELNVLGDHVIKFFHQHMDPPLVAGYFGEHHPIIAVRVRRLEEPCQVHCSMVDSGNGCPRQQTAAPPRVGR